VIPWSIRLCTMWITDIVIADQTRKRVACLGLLSLAGISRKQQQAQMSSVAVKNNCGERQMKLVNGKK